MFFCCCFFFVTGIGELSSGRRRCLNNLALCYVVVVVVLSCVPNFSVTPSVHLLPKSDNLSSSGVFGPQSDSRYTTCIIILNCWIFSLVIDVGFTTKFLSLGWTR